MGQTQSGQRSDHASPKTGTETQEEDDCRLESCFGRGCQGQVGEGEEGREEQAVDLDSDRDRDDRRAAPREWCAFLLGRKADAGSPSLLAYGENRSRIGVVLEETSNTAQT